MLKRENSTVLQFWSVGTEELPPLMVFLPPRDDELCRVRWRTPYPAPASASHALKARPGRDTTRARLTDKGNSKYARPVLCFCGWELDLLERRLVAPCGGVEILPGLEFALLRMLVEQSGRVLRREDLSRSLARAGKARLAGRTVDSYVSRLRRRLARGGAHSLIGTINRVGYRFEA